MKKSTRLNILFAIIILLAAGVLWLCFGHPAAGSGLVAVLTYGDDSTQLRIPLDTALKALGNGLFDLEFPVSAIQQGVIFDYRLSRALMA
mgnify:CR=1 FL=1